MAMLQTLNNRQTNEVLQMAAERGIPVMLTVRPDNRWISFHSRAIAVREGCMWLAAPDAEEGKPAYEFAPASKVGVSFKLKHYKHMFAATVKGVENIDSADGAKAPAIVVVCPTQMQRLQRRAYIRAEIPSSKIVRAAFWLGGKEAEPAGTSPENPVWAGQVIDLSAGGFSARVDNEAAEVLDPGAIVGVRLAFGAAEDITFTDAQYRHAEPAGDMSLMGFQFVGLAQSSDGQKALKMIIRKTAEFQKSH